MRYQSLEDYITTLSESEKEQHKLLIEEHRQRDLDIRRHCDESKNKLEGLSRNMEACAESLMALIKSLNELHTGLHEVSFKLLFYAKALSESSEYCRDLFQHYPLSLN